ncbi:MAG: hypothetical protein OWU84_13405 [Firmicutes bacterium]|nr:hypothetical protein [Bacillota bacterium]
MAIFRDREELDRILGGFFERLRAVDQAYLIYQIGGSVEFIFRKPAARIRWVPQPQDARYPFEVFYGDHEEPILLTFEQDADTAHRFWLGRINLQQALARQQVVAQGPLSRAMKLIPHLDTIYPLYADYLETIGRGDLKEALR